jgi:CheY-specific phosphatase CheX
MTELTLDPDRAKALLEECVTSVFADMAFIDVRPTTGGDAQPEAAAHVASIKVLAPLSCRIELNVPQSLHDRVASTLFAGMEADPATLKKGAEDAILEILNIITGNFLTKYFGQGTDFQLELPQYQYFADRDSTGQSVARFRMDAEGDSLGVSLESVRYRY